MLNKKCVNGMLNLTYKYNKSFLFYHVNPNQNIMQVYFIENNIILLLFETNRGV